MTAQLTASIPLPVIGNRVQAGSVARPSILDTLLAAQRDLTAVERFARRGHGAPAAEPDQARYYRDLVPLAKPGPGEQYAFEVNLDACSGCKSCVAACHTLNGLDEDEAWRSVGLLVSGEDDGGFIQHVTTACHHCLEPACLEGCPVLAYEKDPVTGIVRHLDDQCIGCQYCILKCPYDVPKYNKSKGIVRKCDMCSGRLAAGEAPACVQACPTHAIRIQIVNGCSTESGSLVPGAPSSDYTRPTTTFKRNLPLPAGTLPADHAIAAAQHAHPPLVIMLVLTQLSTGAFIASAINGSFPKLYTTAALAVTFLALAASTLHLGRPQYAFRAILGLRRSWLSREILAFGLFAKIAAAYVFLCWYTPTWIPAGIRDCLGGATAVAGLVGVFCSAMIYHDTRKPYWHLRYSGTKFFLSTFLFAFAVSAMASFTSPYLIIMGMLAKLAVELLPFGHLHSASRDPMKQTALILAGPLRNVLVARLALAIVGGVLLPVVSAGSASLLGGALALLILGEICERYLFFRAVAARRMPGNIHHD